MLKFKNDDERREWLQVFCAATMATRALLDEEGGQRLTNVQVADLVIVALRQRSANLVGE